MATSKPPTDDLRREFRCAVAVLAPHDSAVLAVSGGADSVALACLWAECFPDRLTQTTVAHFDHRLRADSAVDLAFVRELAGRLGMAFVSDVWKQPQPGEAAARAARYDYLTTTARRCSANAVAVAHTADDQAETVLFRIARGTGIAGLAGMPPARPLAPGVRLIRPLLTIRRATLRAYLVEQELSWREDPSNASHDFARNRIRERILPEIANNVNPLATEHLAALADRAREIAAFLDRWADGMLAAWSCLTSPAIDEASLPLADLQLLPDFERRLLLRRVLQRLGWPMGRIDADLLAAAARVADSEGPTAVQLPGGVEIRRQATALTVRRTTDGGTP